MILSRARAVLEYLLLRRRSWTEFVILPVSMSLLALWDANIFTVLAAISFVPYVFFNWGAFVLLRRKLEESRVLGMKLQTLEDDVQNARTLAVTSSAVTLVGLIVLGRIMGLPTSVVPRSATLVILVYSMTLASFPALGWLLRWTDWRGK